MPPFEIGDPSDDTVLMMVWAEPRWWSCWWEDRVENTYCVIEDVDAPSH